MSNSSTQQRQGVFTPKGESQLNTTLQTTSLSWDTAPSIQSTLTGSFDNNTLGPDSPARNAKYSAYRSSLVHRLSEQQQEQVRARRISAALNDDAEGPDEQVLRGALAKRLSRNQAGSTRLIDDDDANLAAAGALGSGTVGLAAHDSFAVVAAMPSSSPRSPLPNDLSMTSSLTDTYNMANQPSFDSTLDTATYGVYTTPQKVPAMIPEESAVVEEEAAAASKAPPAVARSHKFRFWSLIAVGSVLLIVAIVLALYFALSRANNSSKSNSTPTSASNDPDIVALVPSFVQPSAPSSPSAPSATRPSAPSATSPNASSFTQGPTASPVVVMKPTLQPTTVQPTSAPVSTPTGGPTRVGGLLGTPSLRPTTAIPTQAPSIDRSQFTAAEWELYRIFAPLSVDEGRALRTNGTSQRQALEWLAADTSNNILRQYSTDRIIQRYALATLYFSAGSGENFRFNGRFLQGDECTDWLPGKRLQCNDRFRVLELDLSRSRLNGTLENEIGLLQHLRVLDLSENNLFGFLPNALYQLRRVEEINLSFNHFRGGIPEEYRNLTNTTWIIRFDHNDLSGPIPDRVCDSFVQWTPRLYVDCGGTNPEVICPAGVCCTYCCSDEKATIFAKDSDRCQCLYAGSILEPELC